MRDRGGGGWSWRGFSKKRRGLGGVLFISWAGGFLLDIFVQMGACI